MSCVCQLLNKRIYHDDDDSDDDDDDDDGISIVKTCYQLSSRKVDAQSVTNWAVVGQLSR